jgi:hypothetical protein
VSQTAERRRGSLHHESPGAAQEHGQGSAGDAHALAVGRLVLQLADALGFSTPVAPIIYSTASPPPDVASGDAFARIHRTQLRASVQGWTKNGSVRAVTAEAWAAYVAERTRAARARPKRVSPTVAANDVSGAMDAALGIRTRAGAR